MVLQRVRLVAELLGETLLKRHVTHTHTQNARSKTQRAESSGRAVWSHLNARIAGSNPAEGMFVGFLCLKVLCRKRSLRRTNHSFRRVLPGGCDLEALRTRWPGSGLDGWATEESATYSDIDSEREWVINFSCWPFLTHKSPDDLCPMNLSRYLFRHITGCERSGLAEDSAILWNDDASRIIVSRPHYLWLSDWDPLPHRGSVISQKKGNLMFQNLASLNEKDYCLKEMH
jgi:hypothetical protein